MNTQHAAVSSSNPNPAQINLALTNAQDWRRLEQLCQRLRKDLGAERFDRYFDGGAAFRLTDTELTVSVASGPVAGMLDRRFKEMLTLAARAETARENLAVRFVITPEEPKPSTHSPHASPSTHAGTTAHQPARPAPRPAGVAPRHRLEQFVIGAANRLAYEATRRIADPAAATTHHTLYLYGTCGTGKTHLLAGAVHSAQGHGRSARYVTGESFTNEFIQSLRNKRVDEFRRTYRTLDLLCIDDAQALAGKTATVSELQHTFDAILRRGGRVAIAGPVHPRLERALGDALGSRLLAGMVAGLQLPDGDTTRSIVRALFHQRGLAIDPAAELAIIHKARECSVRELEGLVTKVEAVHRLLGSSLRFSHDPRQAGSIGMLAVSRALLEGQQPPPGTAPGSIRSGLVQRPVRGEEIIARVCEHLDVQSEELRSTGRHPRVVLARAIITHLCRRLTTMSYPEIARALGRPNHSTVITAHQRLTKQQEAKLIVDLGPMRGSVEINELLASLSHHIAPRPGSTEPPARAN